MTVAADITTDTVTFEGSNVTITGDATNDKVTIGITKANVTAALGYTPPKTDSNTTYTFATGDANGQIKVTPSNGSAQNISVKGLGSAAYTNSTAYTPSSILPANNEEIKTKYRIAKKAYTGGGNTYWYYEICKFPVNNDGNYASAIISGRIGGWTSSDMSYINALI
uniref:Uncharacterized protein n=1 Tax=Siphoviridae sp. ctOkv13 TaxID=2826314 RepID=A0A8S5M3F7_9CAUD|nr:MAG TPA: hypothetical protein [Siphoviridae sp. ctOkv13]